MTIDPHNPNDERKAIRAMLENASPGAMAELIDLDRHPGMEAPAMSDYHEHHEQARTQAEICGAQSHSGSEPADIPSDGAGMDSGSGIVGSEIAEQLGGTNLDECREKDLDAALTNSYNADEVVGRDASTSGPLAPHSVKERRTMTSLSDGAECAKPNQPKFTPGPWRMAILRAMRGEPCIIDSPASNPIATTEDHGHDIDVQHANAHLIAASPSMHTALQEPMGHGNSPNFKTFADELDAIAGTLHTYCPHHFNDIAALRKKAEQIRAALRLADEGSVTP